MAKATNSALTGQFAALAAALASGRSAEGVYTANGVAVNTLQNNFLIFDQYTPPEVVDATRDAAVGTAGTLIGFNRDPVGKTANGENIYYNPVTGRYFTGLDAGIEVGSVFVLGGVAQKVTSLGSSLFGRTATRGVDFYVKADGTVIPGTGYRAIAKESVISAQNGNLLSNIGDTYFTFNNITKMPRAEVQSILQLPRTPTHVASFNTIQIIDDIKIPNGMWNTNKIPEPITSTMTQWGGTGGATQAITNTPITNFILQPLP